MMYAELMRNHKIQRTKSLCDNTFAYVEYGHRTRNGGWAYGHNMLGLSEIEIQNTAPAILQMKLEKKLKELFG